MLLLAFNPDLPLVATSDFDAGDRRVRAGEVFDWRSRGMSDVEVVPLVATGMLRHPAGAAPQAVETPRQQHDRRHGRRR